MAYPYQKHVWVTREIIRREYLQNLEDGLYDEQQERLLQEAAIRQDIQDEEDRATAEEDALSLAIQTEQTRAEGVESTLNNAISIERQRATAAENNLNSAITTETTRATGVENSLDTRISNEYTRATNAESTLTTNLQAETTRATTAENALGTRVTTLEATATRAYKAAGSVLFTDLPALAASRQGYVYNILDDFTTTLDFVEGAGKDYPAGSDVAIVAVEGTPVTYKYNVMSGFVDTSDFVKNTDYATTTKAGIVKPDGTTTSIDVDGTIHSLGGGQGTAEAAERMIAPIEPDASASTRQYKVGDSLILNDVRYKAILMVHVGNALVVGTNIEPSDSVSADIKKTYAIDDYESTAISDTDYVPMSTSGGAKIRTLWSTVVAKIKAALGTAAAKDSTNAITRGSTDLVESGAVASSIQPLVGNDGAMLNVLGAKNLLQCNNTAQTIRGITYQKNSDGSISTSGSVASGYDYSYFHVNEYQKLPKGKYILSGCYPDGGNDKWRLYIAVNGTNYIDYGEGVEFRLAVDATVDAIIRIESGHISDGKTFYPMIRPASIADDTYVPYAMTNRELTTIDTIVDTGGIEVKRYGRIIEIIGHGNQHANQDVILPSDSPYRPLANVITAGFTTAAVARVGIRPDGTLIFTEANGTPITTAISCYFQLSYTI